MTEERPKRRYNSSRRQAQARETRRHILEAARRLFIARGYAGTTMEAIAREAGVAVETVYAAFGNKRAILARLVDVAVGGDDQPVAILDRPEPRRVQAETDQRRQLRLFARGMAEIMGRVGPLWGVMRAAAATEPEIAELVQSQLSARHANLAAVIRAVQRNGPLRAGLTSDEAADILWAESSAEVHHLLTVDRGWTADHYADWLGDTLTTLLLPPDTATGA